MKKFKPGVSFSDFVVRDFLAARRHVRSDERPDYRRGWLVWVVVLVAFGILFARLASLQIFKGDLYEVLADENRVKTLKLPAERGKILDRFGKELARDEAYTFKDENGYERVGWRRVYPYGEAMAHAIGYINEVKEDEVGILKEAGKKYDAGDFVGRMGLEQEYETQLRGMDGGKLIEVDNMGNQVRSLGEKLAVPGKNVQTAMDGDMTKIAYDALMRSTVKKGAVVASNPQTGEILTLVSAPSFDANLFQKIDTTSQDRVMKILTDKNLPMFNRAIGGIYPPGSTFKMNTTIAAIESGKVKPDFVFTDTGIITVGTFRYTNWLFTKRGGVEGSVGFSRSLTRSTDTFFYKVGEMTGPEIMGEWANKLGMGVTSGIDVPGEVEGVVGVPKIRKAVYNTGWFLGDTYHMAIGQADTLVTPLQVNVMTGTLAADGRKCKPRVAGQQEECEHIRIADKTRALVKEGMIGACSSGGTAFPLFDWTDGAKTGQTKTQYAERGEALPMLACKTGTAEYVAENGKMRTHAWLTVYAPADNPLIAVTVLVEGGGEGSNAAAPIARQVLAKFFDVKDSYPYDKIPQEVGE